MTMEHPPKPPAGRTQIGDYRRALQANPHDKDVAPSPLPRPLQWALVAIFVLLVAAGVIFIAMDRWRRGTTAIGAGLVFLATIRWMVDSDVLGIFAVRSRKFDCLFAGSIGLIMMYLAISVDTLGS